MDALVAEEEDSANGFARNIATDAGELSKVEYGEAPAKVMSIERSRLSAFCVLQEKRKVRYKLGIG